MKVIIDIATGEVDCSEATVEQLRAAIDLLLVARSLRAQDPAIPPEDMDAPVADLAAWRTRAAGAKPELAMIAFRYPGYGWLGFTMSAADRTQLIALLTNQHDVHLSLGGAGPATTPDRAAGGLH